MANRNVDLRPLLLLKALYSETNLKVKKGPNFALTDPIPTYKEAQHGCMLAPLLFIFYMNDVVLFLCSQNYYMPDIGKERKGKILLYANDIQYH